MNINNLTDSELLALADNRFDLMTGDIARSGYGLAWCEELPGPSPEKLAALREMMILLQHVEDRWKNLPGVGLEPVPDDLPDGTRVCHVNIKGIGTIVGRDGEFYRVVFDGNTGWSLCAADSLVLATGLDVLPATERFQGNAGWQDKVIEKRTPFTFGTLVKRLDVNRLGVVITPGETASRVYWQDGAFVTVSNDQLVAAQHVERESLGFKFFDLVQHTQTQRKGVVLRAEDRSLFVIWDDEASCWVGQNFIRAIRREQ